MLFTTAFPPTKKQKVDNSKSPIVFESPGFKPDVCVKVFEVEFHVHSILLKLHSAFFRKFLDSRDKAPPSRGVGSASVTDYTSRSTNGPMSNGLSLSLQYKWISKVDDDRKWHLVADSPKNKPFDHEKFKGDTGFEAAVFEKLPCAIYNRSYIIGSTKDLVILTDFADYYCALPIVSRTLDGALLQSPEFVHNIKKDPCTVFETAAKLRNKVLFREALIWVVGPWTSPNFKNLSDPRLRQVARCVYGEIATKVSNSSGRIMDGFIGSGNDTWSENFRNGIYAPQEPWTLGGSYLRGRPRLSFPCFFRNIDTWSGHLMPRNLSDDDLELSELLKINLVLNRLELRSGDEDEEEADYFLCAEIEDEDLPWDITELDW